MSRPVFLLFVLGGLASLLPPAHAAESRSGCTGFITSLPATITTQGVWCLDRDLSTTLTSGAAITIAANNVTLDCNDHAVVSADRAWYGVYIADRLNAAVRHCTVRGFSFGVVASGDNGGAHHVEDNRIEHSSLVGISLAGAQNLVQRNLVTDTGWADDTGRSTGIWVWGDAIDNTVRTVVPGYDQTGVGIELLGAGSRARGNLVRRITQSSEGYSIGLRLNGPNQIAIDNRVQGTTFSIHGILAEWPGALCRGNTLTGWRIPQEGCAYAPENLVQ